MIQINPLSPLIVLSEECTYTSQGAFNHKKQDPAKTELAYRLHLAALCICTSRASRDKRYIFVSVTIVTVSPIYALFFARQA